MLTVNKLSTRCRAPRSLEGSRALVEEVTHGQLASELHAQLGPSLDRLPAVVRLNRLTVKVRVSARNMTRLKLASVWARAFAFSLHQAMARPAGDGAIGLRRHVSEAEYRARMMHQAASNGMSGGWEFPELNHMRGLTPAQAALNILLDTPELVAEIIAQLHLQDSLERLLLMWDEADLEAVMRAVARDESHIVGLTVENLIEIAGAAWAGKALPRSVSVGRREAITLWTQLGRRLPLRALWHGLRLLRTLVERPGLLRSDVPWLTTNSFPNWCGDLVGKLAAGPAADDRAPGIKRVGVDLLVILDGLRAQLPAVAATSHHASEAESWLASDCAGIFLMLSVVRRLDLWRLSRCAEFSRFGGPRALSFLLAGLGMMLLKPWKIGEPLDPAAAMFAGIFAEPDRGGMKHFFSQAKVSALADFVVAEHWPDALQSMAGELTRSFAARVHGFRNASRQAVLKQFLRIPGRILLEDNRLLVVLEPSPCSVALHMSSMDAALESVEWLGKRRVEFTLQGL
jgi:hypothetical protein